MSLGIFNIAFCAKLRNNTKFINMPKLFSVAEIHEYGVQNTIMNFVLLNHSYYYTHLIINCNGDTLTSNEQRQTLQSIEITD